MHVRCTIAHTWHALTSAFANTSLQQTELQLWFAIDDLKWIYFALECLYYVLGKRQPKVPTLYVVIRYPRYDKENALTFMYVYIKPKCTQHAIIHSEPVVHHRKRRCCARAIICLFFFFIFFVFLPVCVCVYECVCVCRNLFFLSFC